MPDQADSGAFQIRRMYSLLVWAVHALRRDRNSGAERVSAWSLSAAEFQDFLKQVSLKDELKQNTAGDEAIFR